jgi:hypothetical protein
MFPCDEVHDEKTCNPSNDGFDLLACCSFFFLKREKKIDVLILTFADETLFFFFDLVKYKIQKKTWRSHATSG